jgi:hypothetical protein
VEALEKEIENGNVGHEVDLPCQWCGNPSLVFKQTSGWVYWCPRCCCHTRTPKYKFIHSKRIRYEDGPRHWVLRWLLTTSQIFLAGILLKCLFGCAAPQGKVFPLTPRDAQWIQSSPMIHSLQDRTVDVVFTNDPDAVAVRIVDFPTAEAAENQAVMLAHVVPSDSKTAMRVRGARPGEKELWLVIVAEIPKRFYEEQQ